MTREKALEVTNTLYNIEHLEFVINNHISKIEKIFEEDCFDNMFNDLDEKLLDEIRKVIDDEYQSYLEKLEKL